MAIVDKLLLKVNPKAVIERSSFFDEEWYRQKYDIKGDAAKHYLNEGWTMDYNPSERFSSKDYLINNPDIQGINPLLHYEVFGKSEGRRPFVPKREISGDYLAEKILMPYEEYRKQISEKEIVSFDVFDTLIIRPFVKAEDLFVYLEKEYEIDGFSLARKKAESDARTSLKKEVNLDEIYEFIDKKYRFLKEKERECEIGFCHSNPSVRPVYEIAREMGKRVIAVSDMYLSGDIVGSILEKCDYQMDAIYVSCDYDLTKGSGKLFDYVFEKENMTGDRMVHFGDNYISDYSSAVTCGITAFQTPKITDQILAEEAYRPYLFFLNGHNSLSSSMFLAQISEFCTQSVNEAFFTKLGYIMGGPLALGYLHFICEEAIKDNIDEFLFVSRDGYALKELYRKYFYERYEIADAYAYLSRACIYSAAMDNHLADHRETIFSIAKIHHPNFSDRDVSEDEISDWSRQQSVNLKKHLEEISKDYRRLATIDMFSGNYTSQKGAEYYLKDRIIKGYYAGNFGVSSLKHSSYSERLLGMRDNLPVKMSEILITSYESPIVGVSETGKPIYEYQLNEIKALRYEQIMEGISKYIEDYHRFFGDNDKYILSLEEWIDLTDSYLKNCSDEEISELAQIIDSENPISKDSDKTIAELIHSYREQGY